jgi:Ca-activated chloride channel family protein
MRALFVVALSVLTSTSATSAQAQAVESLPAGPGTRERAASVSAGRPQFRSGVDLVSLDVCVRNRNGQLTTGLKPEDFLVLENNVSQRIVLFSAEGRTRLSVSLLVDSSHSMAGPRLERAKAAAAEFIGTLRPDDLVEVISFNERVNVRYALGMDQQRARLSLNEISAAGMTGLYEAALVALRRLEHAQRSRTVEYRNVIVLLTDGEDTSSRLPFDDVLEDVRGSGVLVYTISLRTDKHDRAVAPSWQLAQLASNTGGRAVAVGDLANLAQTYREIGAELLDLYRLAYVPSALARDGSWRSVSVRVPGKDLVIRTRSGYYAPRPPSTILLRKPGQ